MRESTRSPIPGSAVADRELSSGSFRVLLYLAHRAGEARSW
jgi:hypothetical protein